MVIDKYFIHYKKPAQYIYWGENYVEIHKASDTGKTFNKSKTIENVSPFNITPEEFQEIGSELLEADTGILLNSGQFIFNIFEFEKIPFQESLKKDLVEWRLKKVFPENIDDYAHDFFRLSKNRILSILLKISFKEKIENLFAENGINLVYMGNSTVEILNRVTLKKKAAPDFFIEIDKSLSIVVFMSRAVPFYIRKFRSDQAAGILGEISKTVNFVKNSYSTVPRTFSLAADPAQIDYHLISDELAKLDILPLELKNKEQLFFPG